jgi:hypothetical protein
MMTCEKCHCKTHVIYVTRADGKVCDKCKIELTKCRCCNGAAPGGKK